MARIHNIVLISLHRADPAPGQAKESITSKLLIPPNRNDAIHHDHHEQDQSGMIILPRGTFVVPNVSPNRSAHTVSDGVDLVEWYRPYLCGTHI